MRLAVTWRDWESGPSLSLRVRHAHVEHSFLVDLFDDRTFDGPCGLPVNLLDGTNNTSR